MDERDNRAVTKPARTQVEILQRMIGDQAGLIARLLSLTETIPSIQAELEQLRLELAALKAPKE